ncbi:MAG: cyclic nucleotide-binding domain-containing protein [Beijerinckiaceae bacterium]
MRAILELCGALPVEEVPNGEVLMSQGETTGRVCVLVEGQLEILRGDTQVAVLDEPGSIVGEMSLLLHAPHTATVRAMGNAKLHIIRSGGEFFADNPNLSWLIARLLANRLNAATTYLVDLKRQFSGYGNHLEMVGEILESLMHQQERDFSPGSDRDPGRA